MPNRTERKKFLSAVKAQIKLEALSIAIDSSDTSDDEVIFEQSGSESSDDDLDTLLELQADVLSRRYLAPRGTVPKISAYVNYLLPNLDEKRYRAEMRMSRAGFSTVLELVGEHRVFANNSQHKQKPVSLQLMVALYRFGHSGNAASIGDLARKFGISEGSVESYTDRTITALASKLRDLVSWPDGSQKRAIKKRFLEKFGFPNCIGLVDGTLVVLDECPPINGEDYYSRKKLYGLSAMVVSDDLRRILYAFSGFPGSAHDSRVFGYSELAKTPQKFFDGDEYILSDSGYTPCFVVPAYKSPATDLTENLDFNTYLAEARVANEHTIGILKGRFQSLRGLRVRIKDKKSHARAVMWFLACCVLYNVLLGLPDCYDPEWEEAGPNVNDEERINAMELGLMDPGKQKRERVKHFVLMARQNM